MNRHILFACIFYCANSLAQVTVLEPLNFGTIVIPDNTSIRSITLLPNGGSTSNSIYLMQSGHPAELLLEGLGAGVQISFSDAGVFTALSRVNGGNAFTLSNISYSNTVVTTNAYGMATVKIGGQLNTSGNAQPYLDDRYSTTIEITIAY